MHIKILKNNKQTHSLIISEISNRELINGMVAIGKDNDYENNSSNFRILGNALFIDFVPF